MELNPTKKIGGLFHTTQTGTGSPAIGRETQSLFHGNEFGQRVFDCINCLDRSTSIFLSNFGF
jgi:hypothetical protein